MTRKTGSKKRATPDPHTLQVGQGPDETGGEAMARVLLNSNARHGHVALAFAGGMLDNTAEKPGLMDCAFFVKAQADKAAGGDLEFASRMLAAQATTLDAVFAEMARRAHVNFPNHFDASERFLRLALKAQTNCRATLESLAKLHQPREQTVRHVHVNEGGQAIVADQFHHHTGGEEYGKSVRQPHAIEGGGASFGQPLRSQNAQCEAVPIPRDA
jgi:hypothetical protein